MPPRTTNLLIYATSEQDADLLHATGFFVPDPVLFLRTRKGSRLLLSDLEIDRARANARVDQVDSSTAFARSLANGGPFPPTHQLIAAYLRKLGIQSAEVPRTFPAGLLVKLAEQGIDLTPVDRAMLFPERETKTEVELREIARALSVTAQGLRRAFEVLAAAEIQRGTLRWSGKTLTSEILRREIDIAVLHRGGLARDTIVACGNQACDPHERGSGPLKANTPIILDLFPRMPSGYYGDLTRTVVKGRAADAVRKLWETVLVGQKKALRMIAPGVNGADVHRAVVEIFNDQGFKTEQVNGRQTGFFHGTGHGLGLELHEEPRISSSADATLKVGHVFTVEPGLYYPGLGGVRHEDVVVVTPGGNRLLSRLEKPFEIP